MIERVIQQIIQRLPPSSGDDLTGFVIDAEHAIEQHDTFASVLVERSNNPSCLVDIKAILADDVAIIQKVSRALQEVWTEICYQHFQAISCEWFKEAAVLRFITVISDNSFFVTGRISASGGPYSRLVEHFERDFASTHGTLPSLKSKSI